MAELKIKADSGGGTVSWKGPATTTSNAAVQLTLPQNDGDAGQYLKTDGSGNLTWATIDNNTPACQVYMSTNMTSLGNDTLTKLEFDTEDFDTDSAYDTTNKKFTVPANKGGKYLINACAYVAAGVDMYTQLHIYKNGSSVAYNYNHGSASAGGSLSNNITRIITLAATDYIEFYVATNATTRTVYTSNNIARTTASIVRLVT
jgi:hypothetical protein